MTSARAYLELARLQRQGWFVAILPGLGGEVIVEAARGGASVRKQGPTVADVAGELVAECRHWFPSPHAAAAALQFGS